MADRSSLTSGRNSSGFDSVQAGDEGSLAPALLSPCR